MEPSKELTPTQKAIAEALLDRIMPIYVEFCNLYGQRSMSAAMMGIATGCMIEAGYDHLEIAFKMISELHGSRCPLCKATHKHTHDAKEYVEANRKIKDRKS